MLADVSNIVIRHSYMYVRTLYVLHSTPLSFPRTNLEDEYHNLGSEQTYYSIAHTVREAVTEQPSILVNGTLKEYQVRGMTTQFRAMSSMFASMEVP